MATPQSIFALDEPAPEMLRAIRIWLFVLAAMVFAMIVIGGITRLTDSGLSITEWQLLLGFLPPLNEADWQEAFQKYKEIPEYNLVNSWMKLEDFKYIYWWEWAHRFLGRMVGVVFLVPFLFFYFKGQLRGSLLPKLLVMFLLGGLQGALGWYMVKSGLVDRVDVSQYRLAAHLTLAFAILGYILWVAFSLRDAPPRNVTVLSPGPGLLLSGSLLGGLLLLQVALGAFVAGNHAGKYYNTWPLMNGAFIPEDLFEKSPWYINLFENDLTVQFNHRMMAYLLIIWAVLHGLAVLRRVLDGPLKWSAIALPVALVIQAGIGIWTLLWLVPLPLGVLHQGAAAVVFAIAIWHLNLLWREAREGS